ncbi:hypothetical protein PVAND_003050 [Polypedilum vanderplanki]|uniref:Uncharacterized protein n=1 Tax=Polypedilum vanderplanki TaxID=319348 RepID=A0A9J6BTY7_POLVA|nr:hypothetical protein PVAND_003050 [Polypedilum vanderplanki]
MAIVKYFYGINEIIERIESNEARQLLQKCFYDTLGGYLKHLIVPITKYSFYAGNVSLSTMQKITNLYDRCKELLDTNGNTWSDPIIDFSKFTVKILPVSISNNENEAMKSCASLITNNDDEMMVPLPKIETDDEDNLSDNDDEFSTVLILPFKRDQSLFNINSKRSAFVLFRYYVTVTQCFTYQGIDQLAFNRRLKMWINENVLQYLDDDDVYPAFGAVLRILETINDSHDSTYLGSKDRKIKRPRQSLSSHSNLFTDEQTNDFSFDDPNRDIYWWLNAILASIGIFILTFLIVYLLARICCNRKRIKQTESGGNRSLKGKFSKMLQSNTHIPERDEYYEYKKLPTKSLQFENEKSKRKKIFSKLKGRKEKIPLPRLNQSDLDSEDEIVLHDSKISSTTSLGTDKKKAIDESEESRKQKEDKIPLIRSRSPKTRK